MRKLKSCLRFLISHNVNLWLYFFIVFIFCSASVNASFDFTEKCKQAYSEIFNLRFKTAQQLIDAEKKQAPENSIPIYLENYMAFIKAFLSEKENDYSELKKIREQCLQQFDKDDKTSPWYRLCKSEVEIEMSFMRIKNKEYISGAFEIRRGFKLLEENKKLFPDFKPTLKALGVLHAYIGAVPENYHWLLKIAGMHGTISQGISELSDLYYTSSVSTSPYNFLFDEVQLIFIFSKQHLEKNDADVKQLLEKINPDDGIMQTFITANHFFNTGNGNKLIEVLQNRSNLSNDYPMFYLDFLEGLAQLNKLDSTAEIFFNKYLNENKGKGFIKASNQKLAWIKLIQGDTARYKNYIIKCIATGDDFTDEDKQALKEAEGNVFPNVILLKARLLTDGGYYREALMQLAGKKPENFPTLKDKLELTYRLARIFDRSGEKEKATTQYQSTLTNGHGYSYYYAANSALFLGLIYENKNDKENAEKYYRICLKLRNHEYQNSIDQKAKAGLNRLGNKTDE